MKVAVPAFAKVGGGPAFPLRTDEADYKGMTLLDYYAAKAMQAMLHPQTATQLAVAAGGDEDKVYEAISRDALKAASFMLKERDKWLTS